VVDPESSGARLVRVVLDIDPAEGAPHGWVRDEDGETTPFSSWLELLDGVDHALARAGRDGPSGGVTG